MEKLIKSLFLFMGFISVGCVPQFETVGGEVEAVDSASVESYLSTSYTGSQSLKDLNSLRQQGYRVSYLAASGEAIESINGHSGGGYKIDGSAITIYIRSGLSSNEQSHVIAHELVHIKDDLEVDMYLRSYPHVLAATKNYLSKYQTQDVSSFDPKVVSYVLGTLFCTEARAYSRNQQMANEGVPTNYFAKGNSMAEFIDTNYMGRFGQTYGAKASNMANWCLIQSSMAQIQSQLVW